MNIEVINLKEYYLKKVFPYVMMGITLFFYAFPFKGLNNTFNLIQMYSLPDFFYPIFVGLFFVSFIVMIGSFFSRPNLKKKVLFINEVGMHCDNKYYSFNGLLNYEIEGKYGLSIDNKTVWKVCIRFENQKLLFHLLMSQREKKELQNYLFNFGLNKAS